MVFSSLTFLFFFIPVTLLLYFPVKNRGWRNAVLLLCSLVFYSWGEPKFVLLMLLTTLAAYCGALLMERQTGSGWRKVVYIVTIVLIVSGLFVFKYLNFAADNIASLLNTEFSLPRLTLPIGISFYTFQVLSYVIDLYRGSVNVQKNFFRLLLYVSFFPQLIAGPIVRYSTVEEEILNRRENRGDFIYGLKRFIIGLSKKVLLSNGLAQIVDIVFESEAGSYGCFLYWMAILSYTLQLYFDFSGYSDMAIGLGRIFGFHFLENFEHPYAVGSVTMYWKRWHISLSSWFKDYIYVPLGGSRVSELRWVLNVFIVWALTGLWHGASWNFFIWGMYNCLFLIIEKKFLLSKLDRLPKMISWLYAMFCIMLGLVFFNRTDLSQAAYIYKMLFSGKLCNAFSVIALDSTILQGLIYIPLGLLFIFPVGDYYVRLKRRFTAEDPWYVALIENLFYTGLFGLCIVYILSLSYNPFIYFRF